MQVDLQKMLNERGLDSKGLKAKLIERLMAFEQGEEPPLQELVVSVARQVIVTSFSTSVCAEVRTCAHARLNELSLRRLSMGFHQAKSFVRCMSMCSRPTR